MRVSTNLLVYNLSQPVKSLIKVDYCDSFLRKFLGLMLRKSIGEFEGILLVGKKESKYGVAIHMMFMRFDICVIWINSSEQVVDKCIAKRWKPYCAPSVPAKYILETHVNRYADFDIGDQIKIERL